MIRIIIPDKTCSSITEACAELNRSAADERAAGRQLRDLAALVNSDDHGKVRVTLAERAYWKLAPLSAEWRERLEAVETEDDVLVMLLEGDKEGAILLADLTASLDALNEEG